MFSQEFASTQNKNSPALHKFAQVFDRKGLFVNVCNRPQRRPTKNRNSFKLRKVNLGFCHFLLRCINDFPGKRGKISCNKYLLSPEMKIPGKVAKLRLDLNKDMKQTSGARRWYVLPQYSSLSVLDFTG